MRIYYDGFIYDFQQYGGINRYFNEIIARLPASARPIVSSFIGPRAFWPEHPNRKVLRGRRLLRKPWAAPVAEWWLRTRLAMTPYDLAHPTYYTLLHPAQIKSLRRPLVVTVHDMIHELFASELDPHGEIAAAKKSCVLAADAILCNSEHTKQDLLAHFPSVESRVRVTLLAATVPAPSAAALERAKGFRPYFLYVGGRSSYKNFRSLLAVWKRFAPGHPGIELRVVGSRWLPHELEELAESGVQQSVVHHGPAADDELPALYRHSIGLVYPSKYEGFGMPPLEAMSCGTAVICAHSSSLPEVCGEAALYFDPAQPDSLLAQLETLADSSSTRDECIRRGASQAKQFSWDKTAAQTLDLYRALTGATNA